MSAESTSGGWRRAVWLVPVTVQAVLLWLYYRPSTRPGFGDEGVYLEAARSVAEHGTSSLGSFWPPAYAWFLAPLVAAGGGSLGWIQAVQIVLLVVAALAFGSFVEHALGDPQAAHLGRIAMLSFPPLVAFSHYLWPEILHLALMLLAATLLVRHGPKAWSAALAGLLLALCLQTKVLLLPLLPCLLVGLWCAWPKGRRLPAILLLSGTLMVGLLPTLLAQQRDFGRPMLADSGWFNLWVGLNEFSRREFVDSVVVEEYPRYRQSAQTPAARVRIAREKIWRLLEEQGLWRTLERQAGRQYHRLFSRDSFLTHQLVGGALWSRGDGYRAGDSALGHAVRWVSYAFWALVLAGAGFGVALFPYRGRPVGLWVLGFLLIQCAIFLWLHVKSRYRVQMMPGLMFFAVYAVVWWRRSGALLGEGKEGPPWAELRRLAAGGTLAAVLLWLAFAPA